VRPAHAAGRPLFQRRCILDRRPRVRHFTDETGETQDVRRRILLCQEVGSPVTSAAVRSLARKVGIRYGCGLLGAQENGRQSIVQCGENQILKGPEHVQENDDAYDRNRAVGWRGNPPGATGHARQAAYGTSRGTDEGMVRRP
jgi:hypothetical protein